MVRHHWRAARVADVTEVAAGAEPLPPAGRAGAGPAWRVVLSGPRLGWKVIARESGATGLRGRLRAADRRNLIRVMPAKGAAS